MAISDWITIGSVLITIIGGGGILLFKTGGMIAEVKTEVRALSDRVFKLEKSVFRLEKQMHKALKVLSNHHYRIKWLRRRL